MNVFQRTEEWLGVRIGKVTASRVADVVAKTKTGWGASRANYMADLIAERLTGNITESYTNGAMLWGIEKEAEARSDYELYTGATVELVGFVNHPEIAAAGASPDGLVGDDGLVEFKCPQTATHIETLLGGAIDGKYIKQMQWQMAATSRKWCDWVSYDPRMPIEMQMIIRRVPRDSEMIAELENQVVIFLQEMEDKIAALQELHGIKTEKAA